MGVFITGRVRSPWEPVRSAWALQTASTIDLMTIDEAKLHCHVDLGLHEEDAFFARAIRGVVSQIETYCNRGLTTQTWKKQQDVFTDVIVLPMAAPLQSVTSVKYYSTAGVLQTLATTVYLVDTVSEPGRIYLAPDQVWPEVQSRPQAVEVVYVVGHASAELVPGDLLDEAFVLLGDRYSHRENTIVGIGIGAVELPQGMVTRLEPYRVLWSEAA